MPVSSAWKDWERYWAGLLGGIRVPVSGRGRAPDIEHPVFAVEIKYGAVMSPRMTQAIAQADEASRHIITTNGVRKIPLVCISNRSGKRKLEHFVLMRAEDFQTWMSVKNGGQ